MINKDLIPSFTLDAGDVISHPRQVISTSPRGQECLGSTVQVTCILIFLLCFFSAPPCNKDF